MDEVQIAIEVQGLTKSFGHQSLLRSVSFTIHRGEIIGLVGPRGSGKSTLMKLILGFLTPTAGRVWWFPGRRREEGRPAVGYLPQEPRLPQALTASAFLQFCASFSGLSGTEQAARVSEVLSAAGLRDVARCSIRRLSLLEQRLVGLGQAALARPDLMFIDAPTAGLTHEGGRAVLGALDRLTVDGQTVLLSSRSALGMADCCQRILRLEDGEVTEASPAEARARETVNFSERIRVTLDDASPALVELLTGMGCSFEEDDSACVCVMTNASPALEQHVLMQILQAERRILALQREPAAVDQREVKP